MESLVSILIEKLLLLRNIILEDLSNPPVLATLSKLIGMSETKMKQLFNKLLAIPFTTTIKK